MPDSAPARRATGHIRLNGIAFGRRGCGFRAQALLSVSRRDAVRPNLSNSPSRAPPTKASHSSGVNLRTGPAGSLLLRTPTEPPGSSATSTQLPLEKLRELLTQIAFICSLLVTLPAARLPRDGSLGCRRRARSLRHAAVMSVCGSVAATAFDS